MLYPGDTYNFVLAITTSTGVAPNVTSNPVISIVSLSSGLAVVSSQGMTVLPGTSNQVFTYSWSTSLSPNGDYIALVSYAHDSITVNSQLLEKIRLGDSRILGVVALDSTVAKDVSVAKDSTVAHLSDLQTLSPNNSSFIQAIKAKTDNLPSDPASNTNIATLTAITNQILNAQLGSWIVNKAVNPNTLTFFNQDNSVLAVFNLTDSNLSSNRTRIS